MVSWPGATPTGGPAGAWGATQTVWQPDEPGPHHRASPGDHACAPAPGGEQRRIAVGEVKRYVAELGHCLLHVEVSKTTESLLADVPETDAITAAWTR